MKGRLVAVIVGCLLALVAQPALAAISQNTIDPVATLSRRDRHVLVTGPIACTAGEKLSIRLTVTQSATGARAEGRTRLWCTGALQRWTVRATARGAARFDEGLAQVCAEAITRDRGVVTDTSQWCASQGVTLARAE